MKNPLLNQAPLRPDKFDGTNITFAENQPEYEPLPAMLVEGEQGIVVFCWRLNFWQRILVLFTGRIWHSVLTFRQPLQPQLLSTTPVVVEYQQRLERKIKHIAILSFAIIQIAIAIAAAIYLYFKTR